MSFTKSNFNQMTIKHQQFFNLYAKDNTLFYSLFINVNTIDALCNRIDYIAEHEWRKFNYSEEENSDKFKGDLFEIFAEIYFKNQGANPKIGVYNYTPNKATDDYGVDGFGKGSDGKNLTVQVKFRSNFLTELTEKDIKQFPWQSIKRFGVDPNTRYNLVLFTSCVGMHYKTKNEVYEDSIRTIDITHLQKDLNGNAPFWLSVNDAIKETIEANAQNKALPVNIEEYVAENINKLNEDQLRCFNKMERAVKLSVCFPTGSGKTHLMKVDILNRIIHTDEKVFAVATHRIMLNTQHMDNIFELCEPLLGKVGFIFVASSDYESNKWQEKEGTYKAKLIELGLKFDEIIGTARNTTDVNNLVYKHKINNRKVIVITTYHSMDKLKDIDIDVLYCDEAHTLATADNDNPFKRNFEKIRDKTSKFIFLTATPKDAYSAETSAFLMNNVNIFGDRVGLKFIEAVEKGYIIMLLYM